MHEEEVTLLSSTRKRRLKSSFRYSTMKQLENAREYKRSSKRDSTDTNNVIRTLKFSKSLLKISEIVTESDEHESLKSPSPFNEF
jgi:hypothetical protein